MSIRINVTGSRQAVGLHESDLLSQSILVSVCIPAGTEDLLMVCQSFSGSCSASTANRPKAQPLIGYSLIECSLLLLTECLCL